MMKMKDGDRASFYAEQHSKKIRPAFECWAHLRTELRDYLALKQLQQGLVARICLSKHSCSSLLQDLEA